MKTPVLEAIYNRRSIREFTDDPVAPDSLKEIIRAGSWAPSGLNNQPWRFVIIIDNKVRTSLAKQTRYTHIINAAPALIAVYLDKEDMYNPVKDHQAAGACIQNMLLAVEELGLGAVWLGEILNKKDEVNRILDLTDNYDLMAIIAIGFPAHHNQQSQRKDIESMIIKDIQET